MDIDQLIEAKNKFKLAHKTFCWMGPEYRSKELHYLLGSIGSVKNITENTNKRVHYFVWPELSNKTYNSDESYWGHERNMYTYTKYCESEQNEVISGWGLINRVSSWIFKAQSIKEINQSTFLLIEIKYKNLTSFFDIRNFIKSIFQKNDVNN